LKKLIKKLRIALTQDVYEELMTSVDTSFSTRKY